MKTDKLIIYLFLILTIIIVSLIGRNKVYISNNEIINSSALELAYLNELNSCQMDCTLNDGIFHEECIEFNGCVDSPYLKNESYCEKDSDCILDTSCCTEVCLENCEEELFCAISNSIFVEAHSFSCKNNIKCSKEMTCKEFKKFKCHKNTCRIIR